VYIDDTKQLHARDDNNVGLGLIAFFGEGAP